MAGLAGPIAAICVNWISCGSEFSTSLRGSVPMGSWGGRRPGAGAGHRRGCRGGTLPGWASSISRRWPDWLGLLRPSASNACLVALNPRPVSEALCRWVPGVAGVPGLAGHRRGCPGGTLPGWTSPIRHRWTDWLVVLRPSASNGCLMALNPRPVSAARAPHLCHVSRAAPRTGHAQCGRHELGMLSVAVMNWTCSVLPQERDMLSGARGSGSPAGPRLRSGASAEHGRELRGTRGSGGR